MLALTLRRFIVNSLEELNGVSQTTTIEFEDLRTPGLIFDLDQPENPSITINEGQSHGAKIGIDILEIVNYQQLIVYYTIDVTELPDTTVTWTTVPAGCVVTNPSTGIYQISGINTKSIWDIVKSPTIDIPNDYFGTWQYTSSLNYIKDTELSSSSWITTVTVEDVNSLSEPLDFAYTSNVSQTVTGTPQIVDDGVFAPTWTVTVTPSNLGVINTLSSLGTLGGTSSYNASTKVLTIVGNKAQLNSHLAALTLASTTLEEDFFFTYLAVNNLNAETDTKVQIMKAINIAYLGTLTVPTIYYAEDTPYTVSGGPLVTDTSYDGSGAYTYTIFPSSTLAVSTISATGTGGSTSFNNTSKVLTITGTRTQVNSYINNISIVPAADYANNFALNYKVVTPRGASATATKQQTVLNNVSTAEIDNIAVTRFVWTNTNNFPFATTNYLSSQQQYNVGYARINNESIVTGEFSQTSGELQYLPKYGTGMLEFDQIPYADQYDRVTITPGVNLVLGDYTIEMWFRDRGLTVPGPYESMSSVLFDSHNDSGSASPSTEGISIQLQSASTPATLQCWVGLNGQMAFTRDNIYISDGQWNHIAVSRQGSTNRVFLNGSLLGSFSSSSPITLRSTDGFCIGRGRGRLASYPSGSGTLPLGIYNLNGHIDNFAIHNNAKYLDSFAPGAAVRTPNSLMIFNFDGTNGQWAPSAPLGRTGSNNTLSQATPIIVDVDATNPTYTISLSCPIAFGRFSSPGIAETNNYSFTGTKAECNAVFPTIKFTALTTNDSTLIYTQRKNGAVQLTQSVTVVSEAAPAI